MEIISVEGEYTLLREGGNEQVEVSSFVVKLDNKLQADVVVDYASNKLTTVIQNYTVQDGFLNGVGSIGQFELTQVPDEFKGDVLDIARTLSDATKNVVSLIKYYLRHTGISERLFSVKNVNWIGIDGVKNQLPSGISMILTNMSSEPLRGNSSANIQNAINENIAPLIAMRHLHRAKKENISHHKWIDATIAAELAIKEVLSIAKPNLKMLLMELPSPPLAKLYGSILEEYLGEKSPYLKFIRDGVEVRNRLVHKPSEENIDLQKANEYVLHIEGAIFHLLSLIYPKNMLICEACERTKL